MGKFSQHVIDDLLEHLDALDVLELIDFHPESIQRSGQTIKAFCPLCQDLSGRYLAVNMETKEFRSDPPDMPPQSGTVIDLFARCRRLGLDEAVERLADEFGILLLEDQSAEAAGELMAEAEKMLAALGKEPAPDPEALEEVIKRLRRATELEPESLEAQRLLVEARHMEGNVFLLAPDLHRLLELERADGNTVRLVEAAKRYLEVNPPDFDVRNQLADALLLLELQDDAVGELMTLAELAEQDNNAQRAIAAYRRVEQIAGDTIDVQPMIMGLLVSQGRSAEARAEVQRKVDQLRAEEKYREAAEAARDALRAGAEDDDLRLQVVELCLLAGLEEGTLAMCHAVIDSMIDGGRHERAAEALSYLAAERADDVSILERLVTAYGELGEADIRREFEYRLAEIHLEHEDSTAARAVLDEMLEREPGEVRAREMLIALLLREGEAVRAMSALDALLAAIKSGAGNGEEAAAVLLRLIGAAPAEAGLHERLLAVRREAGDAARAVTGLMEAEGAFRDAGRLDVYTKILAGLGPDLSASPEATFALARLHAETGDPARAEALFSAMLEDLLRSGQAPGTEGDLGALLEAVPESRSLKLLHAFALQGAGRGEEGLPTVLAVVRDWRRAERLQEARDVLDHWTFTGQEDLEAHALLSEICAELGDTAGVVDASHRLLALLREKEDHPAATEQALQIVELEPGDEAARRHLAELYELSGDKEQAAEQWRHLVKLYKERGQKEGQAHASGRLLDLDPGDVDALMEVIGLLVESGREEGLAERLHQLEEWMPGETETKIRLLSGWLETAPALPPLHKALAAVYQRAGRDEEMSAQWFALIGIHELQDDREAALATYGEAVKQAPSDVPLRAGLTEALREADRLPEAIEHYLVLADQLRKARKLEDAAAAFEEMHALDPGNEAVHRAHAELLRDMGRGDEALQQLHRIASLREERDQPEEALAILREILKEEPGNQDARRSIVNLLRRLERTEEAVEELRKLAAALSEEDDSQGVVAAYREAVMLQPESPELRRLLVKELAAQGRQDEKAAETAELAALLARGKKPKEALELLDGILKDDPANLRARRERARLLDETGKETEALKEYRELQKLMDENPAALSAAAGNGAGESGGEFPGLEILPEYDFDSFVVGTKNNFAHATALAVARQPGTARNPLFLYSDVGLGKTHLLHAIANELRKRQPDIRIVYGSTEYFTSELVDAIQANRTGAFRNKYRRADVLLLDDVQFLAGKERSQEEFFHIFNMLFQARRQIVVTSDRPPKDIAHLDMRLRSRFGQGVIVDIQAPDVETRLAILQREAERAGVEVDKEVLEVLAGQINSNVRELKGAFNQLMTLKEISGSDLTPELAEEVVRKYFVT